MYYSKFCFVGVTGSSTVTLYTGGENVKKVLFIKNAAILTATALILRCIGIFFRVWLSSAISAEGMGLYQIVISVYVLAGTFATSGICTAVTRIITERLAENDHKAVSKTLKISVLLSFIIAAATSLLIVSFSDFISVYLIQDERAATSIRILCIGLPFIGVCSCLRGYFIAARSTAFPSVCQLFEQIIRIIIIVYLVGKFASKGMEATAAAVMFGDVASEAGGAVLLYIFYKASSKRKNSEKSGITGRGILKEILRISMPISLGRYLHTALRTAENLITPVCLSKYNVSKSTGLTQFGMIKGMALPLLLFPASLLTAVSTLLVPEITESAAKQNKAAIKYASEKVFYITFVMSFMIAGLFFTLSDEIGILVYKNPEVGYILKALSPLIPFMYADLIADGILKGLDQQKFLFRSNVTDSSVRVVLVILLVPKMGVTGFLAVMLFSNLFTSIISVFRIVKVTGCKFNILSLILKPAAATALSSVITMALFENAKTNRLFYTAVAGVSVIAIYFIVMILTGALNMKDSVITREIGRKIKTKKAA